MKKENRKTLKAIYKVLKKASDRDIEEFFKAVAKLTVK